MNNYLFTSDAVGRGHPDKLADQISDAIVDYMINLQPTARVACEVMVTDGRVTVAGEIGVERKFVRALNRNLTELVLTTVRSTKFNDKRFGFHPDDLIVENRLTAQSDEIAKKVGSATDRGI